MRIYRLWDAGVSKPRRKFQSHEGTRAVKSYRDTFGIYENSRSLYPLGRKGMEEERAPLKFQSYMLVIFFRYILTHAELCLNFTTLSKHFTISRLYVYDNHCHHPLRALYIRDVIGVLNFVGQSQTCPNSTTAT